MATTVNSAFGQFYSSINLSIDHREIAAKRQKHIIELLDKAFEITDAFQTGSIPKYTALKGQADLDVMVVLHDNDIKGKTPIQVLQDVRDVLGGYKYKTNVRQNGQAVTLYYERWPNVDIVPVSQSLNMQGEIRHYNVPDKNTNSWIISRPKTHAKNINSKSAPEQCGPNFRYIIKMIKEWNRVHSNYLQSYHIEVLALKALDSNLNDIPWHIYQFFKKAKDLVQKPLYYETGWADDYLSSINRQEVIKRFETASTKSLDAWLYGRDGVNLSHQKAIELWRQIFGEKFPSYG